MQTILNKNEANLKFKWVHKLILTEWHYHVNSNSQFGYNLIIFETKALRIGYLKIVSCELNTDYVITEQK
jgi:hypothetical protein